VKSPSPDAEKAVSRLFVKIRHLAAIMQISVPWEGKSVFYRITRYCKLACHGIRAFFGKIRSIEYTPNSLRKLGEIIALFGMVISIGGILFYFYTQNSMLSAPICISGMVIYGSGLIMIILGTPD